MISAIVNIRTGVIMPEYTRNTQALNENQKTWFKNLNQCAVDIIEGPAGSGKTYIAVAEGCSRLDKKLIDKITFIRPYITTEDFGFLPGTLEEKMDPFMQPLIDVAVQRLSNKRYKEYVVNGQIEIAALAFLRGRAEPLTNDIPTPNGIKKMGDLKVGDKVFGSNGKTITVTAIYPQGKKRVVTIHFTDGTTVKCSEDHLWSTKTRSEYRHKKNFSTKSTLEIMNNIKVGRQNNHEIPILSNPVEFINEFIPMDPYLLGSLLGDGGLSGNSIQFTTADIESIDYLSTLIPKNVSFKKTKSDDYSYRLTLDDNSHTNPLILILKELNLWGTKSNTKFIPNIYKFNTSSVRLRVLQGLVDTDGWVGKPSGQKTSRQQFYSVSETLAKDFKWLVESLGGTATHRVRVFKENDGSKGHNFPSNIIDFKLPENINPSILSRKSSKYNPSRLKRCIEKIEFSGEEDCQCISVDAIDSLYLTSNFVVTHNTFHNSWVIFDEAQNSTPEQMKMVLTRLGDNTKLIITGDLSQSDIDGENGLKWAVNKLVGCSVVSIVKFNNTDIVRSNTVREIINHLEN
jgi:phosphate starvation-inducible protein PhoH and related proteins